VLERPNDEVAGSRTVCPGEHAAQGYSVVWWDPHALDLDKKPSFGVRREELIVKDVPRNVVADGRTAYDRWRLARADARAFGATESLRLRVVREWAGDELTLPEPLAAIAVRVVDATTPGRASGSSGIAGRPGGQPFGLLVHAILARTPLDADRATLADIASIEAHVLGLGDAEAEAAVDVVRQALDHDILRRARIAADSGRCRRETPVTLQLSDGTLLEGTVDLAFKEADRWIVVDYKTDREIAQGDERYIRQVAVYAEAIANATGCSTEGIILRV
jgi:ATP-dependent exoDNAse (exonuclease V) beta subunit